MATQKRVKESFSVIGKEGSTRDGEQFVRKLWAGVEVPDDAEAPDGWVKWTVPGYEYVYAVNAGIDVFAEVLQQLAENGVSLIGAVHDFHDPKDGRDYVYFPIRRL